MNKLFGIAVIVGGLCVGLASGANAQALYYGGGQIPPRAATGQMYEQRSVATMPQAPATVHKTHRIHKTR